MRMTPEMAKEEVLRLLIAEAEAAWGEERAEAVRQTLLSTAEDMWLVCQCPLDPTDEMPE